jgi:hypothetical protein
MYAVRARLGNFISEYWLLIVIVAVKFILQYTLVNPYYELHRDEYLHLDQGYHLAFGFISVPPFNSLVAALIHILGESKFWVMFFPTLFGALTIVFGWLIAESLGGTIWSKLLTATALLFSVLVRLNILFQPNSFDILVWTMMFYFLIKYISTENNKWLWYFAIITALGMNNKYTVAFVLVSIIMGILLTPNRKLLLKGSAWKAATLAFLIFLPNLLWQAANGFPVVDHMRALKETQLDNNSGWAFLAGQIKIQAGSLIIILASITGLFTWKQFKKFRFVAFAFIILLVLFAISRAKDYYSLGIYPVILAFGSVYLENVLRRSRVIIIPALIAINLALFLFIARFLMPVMSPAQIISNRSAFEQFGLLRWEDGKNHHLPQDFADMTGWREMAEKAYAAYMTIPEPELEETLVICDNYGQAGAVNYYNRGRMNEAYSLSTDYIFWFPRLSYVKNVILVGRMTEERIARMFGEYTKTGEVENEYAREKGTAIFVFRDPEPSFTDFLYNEIERKKRELDIF